MRYEHRQLDRMTHKKRKIFRVKMCVSIRFMMACAVELYKVSFINLCIRFEDSV